MKTRREVLAALGTVALGVVLEPTAQAAKKKGPERKAALFRVTALGFEDGLSGRAVLEAWVKQGRERVTVQIDSAQAPAGSQYDVYAVNPTNSAEPVFLGTVTLEPKKGGKRVRGVLERRNYDGDTLPDGVAPVLDVNRVFVTLPGEPVALVLDTDHSGGGGGGGNEEELVLTPTAAGENKEITGTAAREVIGQRQRLRVQVESTKLKAGNFLVFRFNTQGGQNLIGGAFPLTSAGAKRVRGQIAFDTEDGPLPPGANPVTAITAVTVSQLSDGKVLLTGVF